MINEIEKIQFSQKETFTLLLHEMAKFKTNFDCILAAKFEGQNALFENVV